MMRVVYNAACMPVVLFMLQIEFGTSETSPFMWKKKAVERIRDIVDVTGLNKC